MEWAYDGLRQLKSAAGHAADLAATWSGDPRAGEEWCDVLVTAIHQGRTRAHLVDSAEAVIRSGVGSLDEHRSAWPTITSCPGKVVAGVHLDLDDQTAGVWTSATDSASPLLAVTDLSFAFTHRPTKLADEEKTLVHTAIAALT
ncbi:hypothetical protein ACU635_47205 [[Actinomadura] parvosata]|uniref:hypothetical protein n=1 Tax=[Actinomadura] parvosata TaxID=1955412 RepID=UPI00406C41D5